MAGNRWISSRSEVNERMLTVKDRIAQKQQGRGISKYVHAMLYEDNRRRGRNRRREWWMMR